MSHFMVHNIKSYIKYLFVIGLFCKFIISANGQTNIYTISMNTTATKNHLPVVEPMMVIADNSNHSKTSKNKKPRSNAQSTVIRSEIPKKQLHRKIEKKKVGGDFNKYPNIQTLEVSHKKNNFIIENVSITPKKTAVISKPKLIKNDKKK